MEFYVALDGEFAGACGEVIRSASAMGCKGVILVNLGSKKKLSTFGGKGAELFIPQLHYSSWELLQEDFKDHAFVGLAGSAVPVRDKAPTVAIEEVTTVQQSTIFIMGCGKRVGDGCFLTDAQVGVCTSFVFVHFPPPCPPSLGAETTDGGADAGVEPDSDAESVIQAQMRYVVKASICLHRFAALRVLHDRDPHSAAAATTSFTGEKFVLGQRLDRGRRVVVKK
jgi:hypothetical protein